MGSRNAKLEVQPVSSASGEGLKGVLIGGIVGAIEAVITYPTEYIKTQLQLDEKGDRKKFNGFIDCMKKTFKSKGILGFYRGLSVLIVGSIPKQASRFGTFETVKTFLQDEAGQLSGSRALLCGLSAGVSEALLAVTPMETIKVRFINDQRSAAPKYKGLVSGIRGIVRDFGFSGIYQGAVATVLRQGSNQAMRFWTMETLKRWYRGEDLTKKIPPYVIAVFGCSAGAVSVLGNNPIDVIKTRMQGLEASKYKNTLDCAIQTFKNEGPLAFYKGTLPRLLRVCLDVSITFTAYETLKDFLSRLL